MNLAAKVSGRAPRSTDAHDRHARLRVAVRFARDWSSSWPVQIDPDDAIDELDVASVLLQYW